ncbi:MAG TPA: helix-turn-helix transcriptional regulator [Streptosporangiaceae bacterium]|nr:helix-turn-helix transcriptional regulator [Streptosporangiaceae bacterium]
MPEHGGPSVRRRRLAAELRRLREEQGLTGEEVAEALQWSASKISRIETSRTGVKTADLGQLLDVYGVSAQHREELLALARERRRKGWWEAYTDVLPPWYAAYIVLESEAEEILCWSPELVNGLLQTEDYARAVAGAMGAPADPPGEMTRRIQARLRRQRILAGESAPGVTFVLDESVLLRRLGDEQVMRDQLAHLIEAAALPNVSLHVLRLAGTHPVGGGGGFVLLQFPPVPGIGPASDVVHIDQLGRSALYIEGEAETYQYKLAFRRLVDESLDADRSRDLIGSVMREMWS